MNELTTEPSEVCGFEINEPDLSDLPWPALVEWCDYVGAARERAAKEMHWRIERNKR